MQGSGLITTCLKGGPKRLFLLGLLCNVIFFKFFPPRGTLYLLWICLTSDSFWLKKKFVFLLLCLERLRCLSLPWNSATTSEASTAQLTWGERTLKIETNRSTWALCNPDGNWSSQQLITVTTTSPAKTKLPRSENPVRWFSADPGQGILRD